MIIISLGLLGRTGETGSWKEQVREFQLANGLKVLLLEEHKAPIITLQIWYRVGSRNEQLGKTGISHLLEHMMFKGTARYPDFSRTIQRLGGSDNAFTARDYTAYFENMPRGEIEVALAMEADRMQHLRFDPQEVAKEREVVKEERRLRTDTDPVSSLFEQVEAIAFIAHPYMWPIIGWISDLDGITPQDLAAYYQTYYRPNNATLIAVGDFQSEALLQKIRHYFAPIPAGPPPPPVRSVEPPQQGERRVILQREAQLPFVAIGYHVPNLSTQDGYILEIIKAILSQGKSSRLYQNLVYKRQLALFAGADYSLLSADPSLFILYAQVFPKQPPAEVEQALLAELERLQQKAVAPEELQKAKNQLEASFIFAQDSIFYRAMLLGQYATAADWSLLDHYLPAIRKVTPQDIRRVAQRYFTAENRTVGVLRPAGGKEGM
ncbi:MAG: insulinase family protein [Nitrospinota bacterium]|nr:MAG: insulinase family protein [Nitrospinota bacterium]